VVLEPMSVAIPSGVVRPSVCSRSRRLLEKNSVGRDVDMFERSIFAEYVVCFEMEKCVNEFLPEKIFLVGVVLEAERSE
jgi:hypothetical protein